MDRSSERTGKSSEWIGKSSEQMGKRKRRKKKRLRQRSEPATTEAQRADKYEFYQRSVQEPEADIRFLCRVFKRRYGREPRLLREDFCGAALLSCEWVRTHRANRAWGVDVDEEPLAWGREHNVARLQESQAARVHLIEGDVRERRPRRVDVVVSLNFSYFALRKHEELVRYFGAAAANLQRDGLLILDVYGGPEAQRLCEEITEHDEFDYVWDQDSFDPISHRMECHIHFDFPDGSRMRRAFSYDWRLWTVPELRDAVAEAGFSSSEVYWEGTDHETGEGNGVFTLRRRAAPEEAWIAYVVGIK